jgi:hypothetical protein
MMIARSISNARFMTTIVSTAKFAARMIRWEC